MTHYAPNHTAASGEGAYAALSSSLLARKGEALPAVDAVIHEGVEIDIPKAARKKSAKSKSQARQRVRTQNRSGVNEAISETNATSEGENFENTTPIGLGSSDLTSPKQTSSGDDDNVRYLQPKTILIAEDEISEAVENQPAAWKIVSSKKKLSAQIITAPIRKPRQPVDGAKATVKFKMPAREFIRLRSAARDLELSSQQILLEALECYLEANDSPHLCEEEYSREMARLSDIVRRRRARTSP